MGKLIYSMNVSLDGFVETPDHGLDWTIVDDELHTWFNDQMRGMDASLYGRAAVRGHGRLLADRPSPIRRRPPVTVDFARIWNATPRIVFSNSLESVDFNSRLATGDVGEELAALRAEFDGDLEVGGPTLAAEFIKRGLVDEYRLVIHPVILGAGTPFFPRLDRPIGLRLIETRVFGSGVVYQGYAATRE